LTGTVLGIDVNKEGFLKKMTIAEVIADSTSGQARIPHNMQV
jgi:hypothetical protein